jgi:hypothetical protein
LSPVIVEESDQVVDNGLSRCLSTSLNLSADFSFENQLGQSLTVSAFVVRIQIFSHWDAHVEQTDALLTELGRVEHCKLDVRILTFFHSIVISQNELNGFVTVNVAQFKVDLFFVQKTSKILSHTVPSARSCLYNNLRSLSSSQDSKKIIVQFLSMLDNIELIEEVEVSSGQR